MKFTSFSKPRRWAALGSVLLSWVVACGGKGGVDEGGTGRRDTVAVGSVEAVSPTSITLAGNDRVFDLTTARYESGFGDPLTSADVKLGMWVELSGAADASSALVSVTSVRVRPAVRAVVPPNFPSLIGGYTIRAFQTTVGGDVRPPPGSFIEVHGRLSESDGRLLASRVEILAPGSAPFEIRGIVANLDTAGKTFSIAGQRVSYAGLALASAPRVGASVRVSAPTGPVGSDPWPVTRLAVDQELADDTNAVAYVQGIVSGFEVSASGSAQGSVSGSGQSSASGGGQSSVTGSAGQGSAVGGAQTNTSANGPVSGPSSASASAQGSSSAGARFALEIQRIDASALIIDPQQVANGVCVVASGRIDANGVLVADAVRTINLGTPTY
jgi:hypothetical protein